jgi:hypothetical protein
MTATAAVATPAIEHDGALELLAEEVRQHHKAVERHANAMVAAAIAAGEKLLEAKGQLRHGEFGPFLTYCGVSARSARVYMRVARNSADAAVLEASSIRAALDAIAGPSRKRPAPPDLGPAFPRRSEEWRMARWAEAMLAQGRPSAEVRARVKDGQGRVGVAWCEECDRPREGWMHRCELSEEGAG